ncbi:tetratricopeptide repeat protein, partial [Streptomyces incanus]
MAVSNVPGGLDPNVELAAQVGDAAAMTMLGQYHYSKGLLDLAEQWLLAAAEAGDPEAMYDLAWLYEIFYPERMKKSPYDQAERPVFTYWRGRAAEAGHFGAQQDMVVRSTIPDEYREAAEGGSPSSMFYLALLLMEKGQATEAEHWFRAAIDNGDTSARRRLATLLIRQDRLSEAERYARPEAEAGSSVAARQLADLLEKLGRAEEAAVWRAQVETLRAREFAEPRPGAGLAEVAMTVNRPGFDGDIEYPEGSRSWLLP